MIVTLFIFYNGLIKAQSNDTIIRITAKQLITANQTKVYADSCKVQKERANQTISKCIELIERKDGEINALRNANTICDNITAELKTDVANEQKRTKRERFWKRIASGVMIAEFAVIVGLGVSLVISK